MTDTYTLADGRPVPYASPLARIERECLTENIKDMHRLANDEARHLYVTGIERQMGAKYRARLEDLYAGFVANRKAKQRAPA